MKLNERQIIDLRNLKRSKRLNEKNEDDDKHTKVIECNNYEDIIEAIHYMLNMLQKDLLINDVVDCVMDFEEIFKAAKKN